MLDFNTPDAEEPLDSFQIPSENENNETNHFVDADIFHKSEEHIIIGFLDQTVAFLNFRTKAYT